MANKKILIVEDVPDIREIVSEIFLLEGYDVDHANNGREALEKLKAEALPCLILLDLTMPVMDGAQFREEQLKDDRIAHIPVYVMSARHDLGGRAQALKVSGFFIKPFSVDDVLAAAKACCS